MGIDRNPLWDQRRYTEAIVWTSARIVQEVVNKVLWSPWATPDKTFADRIFRAYKRWISDQEVAIEEEDMK